MDATTFQSRHIPKGQVQLAITVVILYDHLTTLDREVELIWSKKQSLAQVFFVINRYLGDVVNIVITIDTIDTSSTIQDVSHVELLGRHDQSCYLALSYIYFTSWGMNIVLWSMQAIMQHRIASIYHNSRKVVYTMAVIYALEIITMSTILGKALGSMHLSSEVIPGLFTIKVAILPPWNYTLWIAPIFMEATIFGFALYAGYIYYRDTYTIDVELAEKSQHQSLTYILLRDSILFPFIALLAYSLIVAGWKGFPNPGGQTTVALAILVTSVFGPHLMLNLREAYYRPFMEEARGQLSGSLKFQHDGTTVLGASDVLGMAEEQSMDA